MTEHGRACGRNEIAHRDAVLTIPRPTPDTMRGFSDKASKCNDASS